LNNYKKVFLNTKSSFSINEKVDIILSPELYWVHIFEIPLKTKKDILNVLPTYFEDYFDVEGYKYYTLKLEGEQFLCFAYDESLIAQKIHDSNLKLSQVQNIYFAQNEFSSLNSFQIDEQYLAYHDNILLKIPKNIADINSATHIDIDIIELSEHSISVNKTNKYIDTKSVYILSFILILISVVNFGKISLVNSAIEDIKNNKKQIKKDYNMLPTMLQTKSVIKTLEKKQITQVKLRDNLKKSFKSQESIRRVSFRDGEVSYE